MTDSTESPIMSASTPIVDQAQPTSSSQRGFNRKTSHRYRLVYRSQEDPLIHDPEAPTGVFVEIQKNPKRRSPHTLDDAEVREDVEARPTGPSQIKTLQDLQAEADRYDGRRENEGEAALYGIMFDDSNYDYMQHLREIGRPDAGPAMFIPAPSARSSTRRSGIKFKDEEEKDEDAEKVLPSEVLPSKTLLRRTYQDQQDVPDAISGLQPDMDPGLREVLEALEDEAYVEDDDAIFTEIITGDTSAEDADEIADEHGVADVDGEDWEAEFAKFKISQSKQRAADSDDDFDEDGLGSLVSVGRGAGKSRKTTTARTSTSGYSMSSSAMFRNEGLSLLDDRFDQIEKMYNESSDDDDDENGDFDENSSMASAGIGNVAGDEHYAATMQSTTFNAIMDDFLENYNVVGKRLVREAPSIGPGVGNSTRGTNGKLRINKKSSRGLAQLREIKEELGKPQTEYIKRRYRLRD
ncbi:Low temperature viability protein-domain-containing protein [Lipomyces chichibuensis]|uniref:Low temperature viability protein-domain-containing protein n=1 Tax=Lipomyces chichibuensis TaxID=1546026 RepID=UPI003343672C